MNLLRRYFSFFWQWNLLLISTLSIWVLIYALNHNDPVSGAEFWMFAALGSLIAASRFGTGCCPNTPFILTSGIPQRFANLTRLSAVVVVSVCLVSYFIFIYSSFGVYIVSLAYRLLFLIFISFAQHLRPKARIPVTQFKIQLYRVSAVGGCN